MSYAIVILEAASKFIDTLNIKMQAKILRTVELLKAAGPQIRMPHSKKITGHENLFELRVQFANDIVRLFYFHYNSKVYVITSGYIKKDQKLEPKEILTALELKKRFEKENNL